MVIEAIHLATGFVGPLPISSSGPEPLWFKTLRDTVAPTTFKKGRGYAETRRVELAKADANSLSGSVRGSSGENYPVELSFSDGVLRSRCSCPAWNTYGPHCKHVVALAVSALEHAPQSGAGDRGTTGPAASSGPALSKLENWLGLSSFPDLEFLYRLAPLQVGDRPRQWVVDVRRLDAPTKGPIHVRRSLGTGTRIAPADERIFAELAKKESRYDSRILLSDEELGDLVELLRFRKVIYRGTPLLFSPTPARPQIHLENRPGSAIARIEFTFDSGASASTKEAIVLLGRKSYVLWGQTLFSVEPDFPPRLFRKWLLEPEMVFPESQVERVLTFFAAHLPRFRVSLKADGVEVEDKVQPTFTLVLEGGPEEVKAQLVARYGSASLPVSPGIVGSGYAHSGAGAGQATKLYLRQLEVERTAARFLLERGFKFNPELQSFRAEADAAVDFWVRGIFEVPTGWEGVRAYTPKVEVRGTLKPRIRIRSSGLNWFELDSEFSTDDQKVDLGAVRLWLNSGRRFIPLKDGSFAEPDREELSRIVPLLEEAGALPGAVRSRLPLYQSALVEAIAGATPAATMDVKARRLLNELQGDFGIPAVRAPSGIRGRLRHYQVSGLAWLWFLHRHGLSGILADDMGLGKTLQALALVLKTKDEEGHRPSLVIAPTSVLTNWEREVERFTPDLRRAVWHGQARHARHDDLSKVDLVFTSYALVRRDLEALSKINWRYVILDEAQNIKNADSATAQACKSLPSDQRLALTGTPLENRLGELWSIFDFLMPGFLGAVEDFAERYEVPIQVRGESEILDRLRRRIHPFMLRRLKDEVAKELPPKTEIVAYCEMEPGQAALYREVLEQGRRTVFETIEKVGFARSRISILAALTRLRQVCCDPRLLKLPPGTLLPPSAKLARYNEIVSDLIAEGHRALVFSQFTQMLSLLTQQAEAQNLTYLYLDGRTRDRMSRVDQFNDPAGPPLFFISLKAGGTGLNLTAADYVLHYDPWWNPAVENQATDRTHRIGQTKAVFSYKLIVRGTVEEKVLALQNQKKELAKGILSTDAALGKALTERDVEDLLQSDGS